MINLNNCKQTFDYVKSLFTLHLMFYHQSEHPDSGHPEPSSELQASRVWTPPDRPEHSDRPDQVKRPELDTSDKLDKIPNYTVYCTPMFYGL